MLRNEECQQLNVDAVMQCIHDMFTWLTIHRRRYYFGVGQIRRIALLQQKEKKKTNSNKKKREIIKMGK